MGLLKFGEELGNVLDRHALQFGEIAGTRRRHVAPRVDQKQQAMQPVLETCRDVRHQGQPRLRQSEIGLLGPVDKGADPASRRRRQWSADRAPLRPGEWRSCDDGSEYAAASLISWQSEGSVDRTTRA